MYKNTKENRMTSNSKSKKANPLISSHIIKNDCIECFQNTLTKYGMGELKVTQTSKGQYSDTHHILMFPRLALNSQQLNNNVIKYGYFGDEHYHIMLPDIEAEIWINGKKTSKKSLYIVAPQEIISVHNTSKYFTHSIKIHQNDLKKYLDFNSLNQVKDNSENIRNGKIELPHLEKKTIDLTSCIHQVFKNIDTLNYQSIRDVEEYIFESIEKLLTIPLKVKNNNPNYNSRQKIVDRALSYINATNILAINTQKIAEKAFCSIRTLEYAFKSVLGVTPKKFLIIKRMHLIRSDIKGCKKNSLNYILNYYGVVNVSRFNQDFYQLFHEYPIDLYT
jgi:AraC family ethanolamine operon transcriptional activator